METSELISKGKEYIDNIAEWSFYQAAYDGAKALAKLELAGKKTILQSTGDKEKDDYRKEMAYGFEFSQWVIDTISNFISGTEFDEKTPNDDLFQMFLKDSDHFGTNWEPFWNEARKCAKIFGKCYIFTSLVGKAENLSQQKDQGIYPYLTILSPTMVYDVRYRQNNAGYPVMDYFKFLDYFGVYHIWTESAWQKWILNEEGNPKMIDDGQNLLGYIPVSIFYNIRKPGKLFDAISEIKTIAYIDASIIRDLMNTDDVIYNAAFPIMTMPQSLLKNYTTGKVKIAPDRILPYTDDSGVGKAPQWIPSQTRDAIESTMQVIDKKEKHIARISGLSVIFASESMTARSGDSIQQSFKFLYARLSANIDNEMECRRGVVQSWCDIAEIENDYEVSHSKKFDIESLLQSVDDAITAKTVVFSDTFSKELQKKIARAFIPNADDDILVKIDNEIDIYKKVEVKDETDNLRDDSKAADFYGQRRIDGNGKDLQAGKSTTE